jgi:hypothetical protein
MWRVEDASESVSFARTARPLQAGLPKPPAYMIGLPPVTAIVAPEI